MSYIIHNGKMVTTGEFYRSEAEVIDYVSGALNINLGNVYPPITFTDNGVQKGTTIYNGGDNYLYLQVGSPPSKMNIKYVSFKEKLI